MNPERLADVRAELSRDGLVVTTEKFWEAAADAIRWMTRELAQRKREGERA